jgi:hypothetical protein
LAPAVLAVLGDAANAILAVKLAELLGGHRGGDRHGGGYCRAAHPQPEVNETSEVYSRA